MKSYQTKYLLDNIQPINIRYITFIAWIAEHAFSFRYSTYLFN